MQRQREFRLIRNLISGRERRYLAARIKMRSGTGNSWYWPELEVIVTMGCLLASLRQNQAQTQVRCKRAGCWPQKLPREAFSKLPLGPDARFDAANLDPEKRRRSAVANAAGSPGSTSRALWSSTTSSGRPSTRDTALATPACMASRRETEPLPSSKEGRANTSACSRYW